jgi:hypothetical protein
VLYQRCSESFFFQGYDKERYAFDWLEYKEPSVVTLNTNNKNLTPEDCHAY